MTKRVQRLPLALSTRDKISEALRYRPKSAEHRAKLSAAATGRVLDEATRRKISETKARTKGMTPEERKLYYRSRSKIFRRRRRMATEQMKVDLLTAALMQDAELYKDVARSRGFRRARTLFDKTGKVSDGCADGKIWWPLVEVKDGVP